MSSDIVLHLIDIAILPEFQRLGIGSAVFKSLIETARTQATPLDFHVEKSNVPAIEFYLQHGCTVIADDGVYLACQWTHQSPVQK